MKIGIDCRMMSSAFGIGRYVQQLVKHLQKIDIENQYVLFLKKDNWDEIGESENFKKVLVDIHWYTLEEQLKMKNIIKKEKVDLMHFPHWNIPLNYNEPFVVTIHDLIMYHYSRPEATTLGPIKFWLKDKIHRLIIKHAVKKAKHIFVTSEFTKQDVHKTLNVDLDKMSVTYQAPFEGKGEPRKASPRGKRGKGKEILQKYNITKSYVLYVGSAYPHKNLNNLLQAWKIFEDRRGEEYQLVLVGKSNFFYEKIIKDQKIKRSKDCNSETAEQRDSVIYTGFVPDDELQIIYENTSLYVFPSLYEGFGLPPLEAQQYGTPVVSSNSSCLPEVLGDSVLYFDPENVEQMVDVIYKGLTDEDIRFDLKNKSKENLQRFSWEELATNTLKMYTSTYKIKVL